MPRVTPSHAGISIRGLCRDFGAQRALHPLDLELEPGAIVGLVGPNGSGKSTLLRLLVGLLRPSAGQAWVGGAELVGDGLAVRQRTAFAPGEIACYPELSGHAHLDWFLEGRGREARLIGRRLMERLGLPGSRLLRAYSHGMKRQLMFAAAMAPQVAVRILDEPTEGLDPTKRGEVLSILEEDQRADRTLLLSSHHLGEVDRACERLLFLNAGRLIADERAAELGERSKRLLRLSFPSPEDAQRVAARVAGRARSVQIRAGRLTIELERADPRPLLADWAADPSLPQPERIDYGQLSLPDLYRDLYGVEGL